MEFQQKFKNRWLRHISPVYVWNWKNSRVVDGRYTCCVNSRTGRRLIYRVVGVVQWIVLFQGPVVLQPYNNIDFISDAKKDPIYISIQLNNIFTGEILTGFQLLKETCIALKF